MKHFWLALICLVLGAIKTDCAEEALDHMPLPELCKKNLENISGVWSLTVGSRNENLIVVKKSQIDDDMYIFCQLRKSGINPTEVGVMTAPRYGIKNDGSNFLRKHSVIYTLDVKPVDSNGNTLVLDKDRMILPTSSNSLRSIERRGADLIETIPTGVYKWSILPTNTVVDKDWFAAGFSEDNCSLSLPPHEKLGFFRVTDKFCIFSWGGAKISKVWMIDTRNIKQRVITEVSRERGEHPRVFVYFTNYESSGKATNQNDDYYGSTTLEYDFSDPKKYLFKSEDNETVTFKCK